MEIFFSLVPHPAFGHLLPKGEGETKKVLWKIENKKATEVPGIGVVARS
ncbi:MAG: hypothetical protein WC678_00385 [Parcubacteria group bacterium]|jgi:hypothetical protein